jgi:hypothetical protein
MENFVLIGVFVLLGMLFQRLKSFPRKLRCNVSADQ